eukprot:TRINITY_DN6300_c0_g1_i5.p2 TRINITY_DN6300_c0_g1~~TRINITY_DN6300_c0_g1_i5.p2  ORF type:complete len:130 (+),score=12.17 TRINITY_DN6300_c0_g1_i5:250-639(+)
MEGVFLACACGCNHVNGNKHVVATNQLLSVNISPTNACRSPCKNSASTCRGCSDSPPCELKGKEASPFHFVGLCNLGNPCFFCPAIPAVVHLPLGGAKLSLSASPVTFHDQNLQALYLQSKVAYCNYSR